jgi:hypothetical protein
MKNCTIESCTRAYYAKGLCEAHYQRTKKGQSLTEKSVYEQTPIEKFQSKYEVMNTGCWHWKNPRPDGRANTFWHDGKVMGAYKASYLIHKGPVGDLWVLHTCDNGLCVNPDHLFLGTPKDNTQDMIVKGRQIVKFGESRGKVAKLTEVQAREIKAAYEAGAMGTHLAKQYGVHFRTIYDLVKGRTWPHIM